MKTNESTHTPTPWRVASSGGIAGSGESIICNDAKQCIESEIQPVNNGFGRAKANAEFIVRACNAHDDLVNACRLIYEEMGKRLSPAAFDEFSDEAKDLLKRAIAQS